MLGSTFSESRRLLFVSDAHLGAPAGPPDRETRFVDFLERMGGSIDGLMIVGDLFDFWFEYRHAIPKGHFRALAAIAAIRARGIPVLIFGGNHDFWAGAHLRGEVGIETVDEPVSFTIQGRRVFVAHGDGLGGGDHGYKLLKRVLRSRACIALYRSIHPDIGIPFAYRLSSVSRRHTEPKDILLPKLVRDIAAPRLREGHDAVVMGHVHEPTHVRLSGGDYLILGDWIENFTYAILEEGRFTLFRDTRFGGAEAIPAEIIGDR